MGYTSRPGRTLLRPPLLRARPPSLSSSLLTPLLLPPPSPALPQAKAASPSSSSSSSSLLLLHPPPPPPPPSSLLLLARDEQINHSKSFKLFTLLVRPVVDDAVTPGGHLDVAAQVDPFESKGLKPGFHLIGARVETTWVPGAFQVWVRGSQRAPGAHLDHLHLLLDKVDALQRVVAVQVTS
jgi:hypothetical protein